MRWITIDSGPKKVSISSSAIKENQGRFPHKPVVIVEFEGDTIRGFEAEILGPSNLHYDDGTKWGPRVWLQTEAEVRLWQT